MRGVSNKGLCQNDTAYVKWMHIDIDMLDHILIERCM